VLGVLIAGLMVLLLIVLVRFVQPELFYWLRDELTQVRAVRLGVYRRAMSRGDLETNDRMQAWIDREALEIMVQDLRPERSWASTDGMFKRCLKIRELYRAIRTGLSEDHKRVGRMSATLCIVELSAMVSCAAREIEPNLGYTPSLLSAEDVLRLVTSSRGEKDLAENDLREALMQNPISIEEVIEIQIACVYALLYRLKRRPSASRCEEDP